MLRRLVFLAAIVCLAGQAQAVDLPAHRSGLWQMTMRLNAPKGQEFTIKRCADHATDMLAASLASGWAEETCTKRDLKREGETLVIESICKVGSAQTHTHVEIAGSFEDSYTMKVLARREGAAAETREIAIEAKWLGPCAADQKPGDIILPGGITMNVRNIRGMLGLDAAK
jgi:hypothetical protein